MDARAALPEYIRQAFHASEGESQRLGVAWDYGWKVGNVVFSTVLSPNRAVWSARLREKLQVEQLRVSQPVRSTDSRFMNAGWRANVFIEGEPAARADEVVSAAVRLDTALSQLETPEPLREVDAGDAFSVADRAAWSEDPVAVATGLFQRDSGLDGFEAVQARTRRALAMRMIHSIAPRLEHVDADVQVCHADAFGTTLFSGTQVPALSDVVPVVRPFGYSAAIAAFDALVLQSVDEGILRRYMHIPNFDQLVLRAATYRLMLHGTLAEAKTNSSSKLEQAAEAALRGALPQ
ncbi:TIGR02569 family protein [Corynebacterium gerontici]|nr:TIGR02569 family protein [Corynebacterium gerontici]